MPPSAAPAAVFDRTSRLAALEPELDRRILVLEGPKGTEIQALLLDEAAFRGERFASWPSDLRGDNDLLNITRPEAVAAIHRAYAQARADILSTHTFNSTRISQSEYRLRD